MATSKRKTLIRKLDKVFSQFVRLRATDLTGNGRCFTCHKPIHWKEGHAGHFMGRIKMSTRWDEYNVQLQCVSCNVWGAGEQYKYAKNLDATFGKGTAERLESLSQATRKWDLAELQAMHDDYKERVQEMLENRAMG